MSGALIPNDSLHQLLDPMRAANQTLAALSLQGMDFDFNHARTELLDRLIFSRNPNPKQPFSSYRRLLRTSNAKRVLNILWKESSFVSEEELRLANMSRTFIEGGITVHGLAVGLAETPSEVGALNTSIGNIATAAECYGLLRRDKKAAKLIYLSGTDLLHSYMIELSRLQLEIVNTLELPAKPTNDL